MVIWSETSKNDLRDILYALITWKKHKPLSVSGAKIYIRDLRKAGDSICKLSYHPNATYESHRIYGKKVHRYKRSTNTMWYLIYPRNTVTEHSRSAATVLRGFCFSKSHYLNTLNAFSTASKSGCSEILLPTAPCIQICGTILPCFNILSISSAIFLPSTY